MILNTKCRTFLYGIMASNYYRNLLYHTATYCEVLLL